MWGKSKEMVPERLCLARGGAGSRQYLVKWRGRSERDKSWAAAAALPKGMVDDFESAIDAPSVIMHVVRAGEKEGTLVVQTNHNAKRVVPESEVPAEALATWREQVAKKKMARNKQHHCRAAWCSRRGESSDFVSCPPVYMGANHNIKTGKDKTRVLFYSKMHRKDVIDGTTPWPTGNNWKVCKCHFSDVQQRAWLPLHDDPVFNRRVDGIRLREVVTHSMFATARAEATKKHGTSYSKADARTSGVGPAEMREGRMHGRVAAQAGLLSPGATSSGGAADGSKVSPAHAKAMVESLQGNFLLDQSAEDLRRKVEQQQEVITMLQSTRIAPLSFQTLTTGVLHEQCRKFAVLSDKGAVALVETAEALGLANAWEETMKAECIEASLAYKRALGFGFRNAAMLVCAKCKLADSFDVLGYMFGIGPSEAPLTGLIFKVTLQVLCAMLRRTVARVPDTSQVDADTLPDFKHAMFSNVGATVDASNAATQTSHNPHGDKHSHSKYYGGNCGKYSVAISNDGLPMWLSFVYGGRASESGIMMHSNFEDWYREFMAACVDEDGKPFDPSVMADKGTKIQDMMKRLGCGYITPSQLVDRDLTAQDLQENELIAKARGHVERAIGKAKRFRILTTPMHHRLLPVIDDILFFCFFATHFCDA
jgi:hypothetical protein